MKNNTSYIFFINIFIGFSISACFVFMPSYSFAQKVIFQSGFETCDPAFTSDLTTASPATISTSYATNPKSGTKCGHILGQSANPKTYDGSIITSLLSLKAGVTYTLSVYARTGSTPCGCCYATGKLSIYKNITATNAAMKASAGNDIILAPGSDNVLNATYALITATFTPAANESKYIGFQMYQSGCASAEMFIDDVIITTSASHCSNSTQDADETGVDCGGNECGTAPTAGTISPSSQSLACGSGNFILNVCSQVGYNQWQFSPDNVTWYDKSGANGTALNGTLANTGYFRVLTKGDGCGTVISNTATITITGTTITKWKTTAASTSWATAANWDNGVPLLAGGCTNVVIQNATTGNYPTVPDDQELNNVTIDVGATLTNNQSNLTHVFKVDGNFINNGNYNDATSGTQTCLYGLGNFLGGSGTFLNGAAVVGQFQIGSSSINADYTITSNVGPLADIDVGASGTSALHLGSYYLTTTGFNQSGTFDVTTGTIETRGSSTWTPTKTSWNQGTYYINWPSNGSFNIADDWYNVYFQNTGGTTQFGNTALTEDIRNDMWIKSPCILDNSNAGANTINIGHDFINDGTYTSTTATINMNGSAAQQIRGTSQTTFYNLKINNTSSTGVTLNVSGATKGAIVTGALTLTDGYLYTTSSQLLIVNDAATCTSPYGTSTSFVTGPMRKVGNDNFVFPVGDIVGGTPWWRRIGITGTGGTNTDQFYAQYFHSSYPTHNILNADSTSGRVKEVSGKEYWILDRTAGTYTPQVTLYWEDAAASDINSCTADLVIAHFDISGSPESPGGLPWELNTTVINPVPANFTLTGSCAGNGQGTIQSPTGILKFSPFTFGSKSLGGVNPLPVELLSFSADCKGDMVIANWETASEQNSDYFTLEKSTDGTIFYTVAKVTAAGNSTTVKKYSAEDAEPFSAASYYRLSETDFNGQAQLFEMIPVKGCGNDAITAFSSGNNVTVMINSKEDNNYNIVLMDAQGKIVLEKKEFYAAGNHKITFTTDAGNGIYFLKVYNDKNIRVQKLSIQK